MIALYLVIAGIIVCLCLSAFFSSSEMAYSSCNSMRLESIKDDKGKDGSLTAEGGGFGLCFTA